MSESTEQIGNLWTNLSQLRSIIGDTPATTRLQSLIASIDERLGQLDRAVRERIALVAARDRASNHISDNVGALAPWRCVPQASPSGTNDPVLETSTNCAPTFQRPRLCCIRSRPWTRPRRSDGCKNPSTTYGTACWTGMGMAARGVASDQPFQKLIQAVTSSSISARARTACFNFGSTNWLSKSSPAACNCRCSMS